jgi:4-amino-4-deoxy-L-arabinose transferase-like glycosyltransferase
MTNSARRGTAHVEFRRDLHRAEEASSGSLVPLAAVPEDARFTRRQRLLLMAALVLTGMAVRLVMITQPYVDYWSWRQSDVAMIAENFYRQGFQILWPQINWAGPEPGYVGTEFPLVPFLAALLYGLFGVQEWIGRTISVVFFATSIPFFFLLVRRVYDDVTAGCATAFYCFAPLSVVAGRSFMPDVPSLALGIAALYLFLQWLEHDGVKFLLAACVVLTLALLVKIPTIMIGLPMLYLAVRIRGSAVLKDWRIWLLAAAPLAVAGAWYVHAYQIAVTYAPHHLFGERGLGLASLERYLRMLNLADTPLGMLTPVLVVLALIGLGLRGHERIGNVFHWWALALLVFVVVGGSGNSRHDWYRLPLVPIAAALGGAAFVHVTAAIARKWGRAPVILASAAILVLFGWFAFKAASVIYVPWDESSMLAGAELNRSVAREALVAVIDRGNPTALYYSKRKGWHFPKNFGTTPADSAEAIRELSELHQLGLRYLVLLKYTSWWLDYYTEFRTYLETTGARRVDTPDFIIFELEEPSGTRQPTQHVR